jgi:hypothetical protein
VIWLPFEDWSYIFGAILCLLEEENGAFFAGVGRVLSFISFQFRGQG